MKTAPDHLIYESAYRANILPLTSHCNVRCVFCSHPQNPPETEVYRIPHRSLDQVKETLQFINPNEKIVIGESVTKIIEGEPFTHPQIREILETIREQFPETVIQMTTNGTMITREAARFLRDIGFVELNLSLNSSDKDTRSKLIKDPRAKDAVRAAEYLGMEGVSFHGSLVAMPHITGWNDIRETIFCFNNTGADTVRIFLPGFTRLAPAELVFEPELWQDLNSFIEQVADEVSVPLTVEPPLIHDLTPVIRGVIKGSPAEKAGLRKNDIIWSVNKIPCFSRVDAFTKILAGGTVKLDFERDGRTGAATIQKEPLQKSGLVMDYDLDPHLLTEIERAAAKYDQVTLLCSLLAEPVFEAALKGMGDRTKYNLLPVRSRFFGGSIKAAGLLVVSDFLAALEERGYSQASQAVFLPSSAFDRQGRDLTGANAMEIEKRTGKKVQII